MTTWRPHSHIRVVAIGLHWRDGRLLAADFREDTAQRLWPGDSTSPISICLMARASIRPD
ncbi:hypothetical protein ACNJX9_07415 [Bradyrhizobium sp. DASA03076]|jgi:hypothetical protein|uniref:hypothetical protein n=1 Tax=Bradyrhizobium sp. BLXBL-03 TaxID=3395916 RepID=UPI003F6EB407